jgi:hypothetical protein
MPPRSFVRVSSLETIFRALAEAKASYLVVGGVAVIAHGHVRFTHYLDLVLNLSSDRLVDALKALQSLGYGPRIPVGILDFADPQKRSQWQTEKRMLVFNVFSERLPDVTIDIFPTEPFDFATEYEAAMFYPLTSDLKIPVVSLQRLLAMKKMSGRPQDLLDVEKLAKLADDESA